MGIWEENGFLNAKGKPVVNRVGVEKLQDSMREREREGCRVRFWLVGKKENREAVALADEAFDKYVYLIVFHMSDFFRLFVSPLHDWHDVLESVLSHWV